MFWIKENAFISLETKNTINVSGGTNCCDAVFALNTNGVRVNE